MTLDTHIYDLIIIGAGPAGLSAAVYAGRAMVDTLILEKGAVGGQVTTTKEVVNYPGVPSTTGPELVADMYKQAQQFDVLKKSGTVERVELEGDIKRIHTKSVTYQARAVLIATGAQPRKIGFPGESEFTGRGVAYCATCDGEFYTNKPVLVVGGGYAAAEEAIFLTRFASEVHILIRKGDFSCAASVAEAAKRHPNIQIHYHTEVKEVFGDTQLHRAVLINNQTQEETVFEKEGFGLFVLAGTVPQTEVFKDLLEVTPEGYIPVDHTMQTSIPGVYAAGDILPKELRQIVTATADGAVAGTEIAKYVLQQRKAAGIEDISEAVIARQQARLGSMNPTTSSVGGRDNSATTGLVDSHDDSKTVVNNSSNGQSNTWFDEAMVGQLKGIFGRLTKNVEIAMFIDPKGPKVAELRSFMQELAAIDSHLSVTEYTMNDAKATQYNVVRPSTSVLVVDGQSTGVRYAGVPSGHEVNSIILGIYNVAGPGQDIEPDMVARIQKLGAVKLEVCASLSCHFCPDVVAACQRMSSLNHDIQGEMIDAVLYPELKEAYNLMSFPTLVINDGAKILYGAQSLEDILTVLESM